MYKDWCGGNFLRRSKLSINRNESYSFANNLIRILAEDATGRALLAPIKCGSDKIWQQLTTRNITYIIYIKRTVLSLYCNMHVYCVHCCSTTRVLLLWNIRSTSIKIIIIISFPYRLAPVDIFPSDDEGHIPGTKYDTNTVAYLHGVQYIIILKILHSVMSRQSSNTCGIRFYPTRSIYDVIINLSLHVPFFALLTTAMSPYNDVFTSRL